MGYSSQIGEPEAHYTDRLQQLNRLEGVFVRYLNWSKYLPSSCSYLWGFFAGFLFCHGSLQPGFLPSGADSQLLLLTLAGGSQVNLVSFRNFLMLFWVLYLPDEGDSYRMECFNLKGTCYTTDKYIINKQNIISQYNSLYGRLWGHREEFIAYIE